MTANVLSLDGTVKKTIELPSVFSEQVRPDLIRRAVLAENTWKLQPQGHSALAGMQTSAAYFGAMSSYRTGRHMGIAIRPREKLGGGVQGKVKRIPSATKGRRAHPHQAAKIIAERINRKEYQMALASAVSATVAGRQGLQLPLIIADDIESVKKTRDVLGVFKSIRVFDYVNGGREPHIRKNVRRSTRMRIHKKKLLLIVGNRSTVLRAARNIPGVDVCLVKGITANLLAPGGVPGRLTVWSESAARGVAEAIAGKKVR